MPFVLDASLALSWHFEDENPDLSVPERAFREGVAVPQHFFLEIANGLLRGERRLRTAPEGTDTFLARLADLKATIDPTAPELVVSVLVPLSRDHRLSIYDAAYLELAGRLGLDLATCDSSLAEAARRVGIALIEGTGN
ncbi:MAG TPA: type II toxin-antitoxin system VapC family toxin [Allosphingosinicella sp.]